MDPHISLSHVPGRTALRFLRGELTTGVNSTRTRSVYSFSCGCVAERNADSDLFNIKPCSKHHAGLSAIRDAEQVT